MSCTPIPKASKPVWALQMTRLPCLVVHVTFQNDESGNTNQAKRFSFYKNYLQHENALLLATTKEKPVNLDAFKVEPKVTLY